MIHIRRAFVGLVSVAAVLAATPAISADAPPNAHSLALSRQLFAEMHMDQMMDQMMKSMVPAMTQQARNANPQISEADAYAINEAVAESTSALMTKMIDRMIPLYASTFSEKELQDIVDFYGSPSGKSMLTKMPTMMTKMTPMIIEMMPEVTADMRTRICAKIDCSKTSAPPKSGT